MVPGINNIQGVGSGPLQTGAMKVMNGNAPVNRQRGGIYFNSPQRNQTLDYNELGQNSNYYNSPLPT